MLVFENVKERGEMYQAAVPPPANIMSTSPMASVYVDIIRSLLDRLWPKVLI